MADDSKRYSTTGLWAADDPDAPQRDVATPIHHSVTFAYRDMDEWFDVAVGKQPGHIYSRNTNPTVRSLELTMAERSATGIPEGLVGYSAGVENDDDLIADLDQALATL